MRNRHRRRAGRCERQPESPAAGVPGSARTAVRLLHAGHSHDAHRVPARMSVARRSPDPSCAVRTSVPLHRLAAQCRRRAAGRLRRRRDGQGAAMTTRQFGMPMPRNEDARLLSGRARFIDDIEPNGVLHAALLRSPYAHARILRIDAAPARARDGVAAVFTAADLGAFWQQAPMVVPPAPIPGLVFHQRTQVPLAKEVVRHVGEPVALVLASSRYLAEDAVADIVVEWEPLPVAAGLEQAVAPAAPRVHDDLDSNVSAWARQTKGDYPAAARAAAHIIRRRIAYDHGCAQPMETRGVLAQWDADAERLTVWDTTQAPIPLRNGLAGLLGLSERQVRVVAPFIGGGFGPKVMMFYPEELLVPWAAIRLRRPVKWIE